MTLYESFMQIDDPRRSQGKRTSLSQMFCMVCISYLCGHHGYRPVYKFCKAHVSLLGEELGLRHGIPSYVTFRDVMMRVDEQQLIRAFNAWAATYVSVDQGDWVSGDGKALASTVEHMQDSQQNFQAVVSIFCHKSGLIRLVEHYHNSQKSEQGVLKALIEHLRGAGAIIRMDALHTQKND